MTQIETNTTVDGYGVFLVGRYRNSIKFVNQNPTYMERTKVMHPIVTKWLIDKSVKLFTILLVKPLIIIIFPNYKPNLR